MVRKDKVFIFEIISILNLYYYTTIRLLNILIHKWLEEQGLKQSDAEWAVKDFNGCEWWNEKEDESAGGVLNSSDVECCKEG